MYCALGVGSRGFCGSGTTCFGILLIDTVVIGNILTITGSLDSIFFLKLASMFLNNEILCEKYVIDN